MKNFFVSSGCIVVATVTVLLTILGGLVTINHIEIIMKFGLDYIGDDLIKLVGGVFVFFLGIYLMHWVYTGKLRETVRTTWGMVFGGITVLLIAVGLSNIFHMESAPRIIEGLIVFLVGVFTGNIALHCCFKK